MSNDHIPDVTKMISDTPRTDAEAFFPHDSKYRVCDVEFARTLERELNESNQIIRQQQLLDEENLRLQERIRRLEEELNELRSDESRLLNSNGEFERRINRLLEAGDKMANSTDIREYSVAIQNWTKAKEAKS